MKIKEQISTLSTLSSDEKDELFSLIKTELDLAINNNIPRLSEINEAPDTPMKAYIRQAKMNVANRRHGNDT